MRWWNVVTSPHARKIYKPRNWRPWRWHQEPGHSWDEPLDTTAYRDAVAGVGRDDFGSLGYTWVDKPHRLIYQLCDEVDQLRARVKELEERDG